MNQKFYYKKKSHACEGGAHLRISFWYLLINSEKPEKSEIWKHETKIDGDIIILHMCTKNQNNMRYSSWDTEWDIIFGNFRPFFALSASKMKISKKMRKKLVDINILHKCMRDHDHKLYCSWDMVHDTWNCYFSFWVSFLPFYPTDSPKNQNFRKKKKTPGDIIILHMWIKNYD